VSHQRSASSLKSSVEAHGVDEPETSVHIFLYTLVEEFL
jgi:hypothetical protein